MLTNSLHIVRGHLRPAQLPNKSRTYMPQASYVVISGAQRCRPEQNPIFSAKGLDPSHWQSPLQNTTRASGTAQVRSVDSAIQSVGPQV
jgi:hypothetical protein